MGDPEKVLRTSVGEKWGLAFCFSSFFIIPVQARVGVTDGLGSQMVWSLLQWQGKTISIRLEGTIGKQVLRLWILEGTIKSRHKDWTIKPRQLERTIEVTNGANGQDVPKDERQSTDASKERTYARRYYVNLKPLVQEGTTKSRHLVLKERTISLRLTGIVQAAPGNSLSWEEPVNHFQVLNL